MVNSWMPCHVTPRSYKIFLPFPPNQILLSLPSAYSSSSSSTNPYFRFRTTSLFSSQAGTQPQVGPVLMEELFQYMKTLRSQINDVADQAAKLSVEEHMLCTTVETLQKDLDLVKNETRQVKEETDQMTKAKGKIYSQILQNQRKIALLESDSSTLSQTLKLMQQEKLSLSAKLVDQSAYYEKVGQDISAQLTEHQEWINAQDFGSQTREVNEKAEGTKGQSVMKDFQAAQANFGKMGKLKSDLALQNTKLRQSVELVKTKMTEFKSELWEMDEKSLEEELQALLSDKSGEAEYVQSLQLQIMRVKEISHIVRCSCGEEYNVKLDK